MSEPNKEGELIFNKKTSFNLLLRGKEVGLLAYHKETGSWKIASLDLFPHLVDRRFLFLGDAMSYLRRHGIDLRKL